MKTLYILGGPMGVGKTTVAKLLTERLPQSVFLDGDWCWNSNGEVNDETKRIVVDNAIFLLNSYLQSQSYQNVVFCWVLHLQSVLNALLSALSLRGVKTVNVSLTCSPSELRRRILRDVDNGLRQPDVLQRSLCRLACFGELNTAKLDTTTLSPQQVVQKLLEM